MVNAILLLLVARRTELGVPTADRVILAIGGTSRADLQGVVGVRSTVSAVGVAAGVLAVEIANLNVLVDAKAPVRPLSVLRQQGVLKLGTTYTVHAAVRAVLEKALAKLSSLGCEGAGEQQRGKRQNANHGGG